MATIEKADIAELLGKGLHIFLNGKVVSCETDGDIERLKNSLEYYQAALATKPLAASLQNGFSPRHPRTGFLAATKPTVQDVSLADNSGQDKLHRDASKRIGKPATYREIYDDILKHGGKLPGKFPLDAMTRRIRADAEMVKTGKRLRDFAQGAAEVLWAHRDLLTEDIVEATDLSDDAELFDN